MILITVALIVASSSVVWTASLDTLFYKSDKIVCPDGQWTCDDESTCCQLPDNQWACCVYKDAQCCADRTHCCPKGSTCDVGKRSCHSNGSNYTTPAVRTVSRVPVTVKETKNVRSAEIVQMTCPDRSICPYAGAACCRQYTGRYTCCNYPLNVCCDDGLHCCHVGTVCDPIHMVCIPYPGNSTTFSHSWAEMTPAHRLPFESSAWNQSRMKKYVVATKKSETVCADGHTCCTNQRGQTGLCVLDGESVCCDDGQHCCPKGTTCDASRKLCTVQNRQTPVTPWSSKTAQYGDSPASVVCPGSGSECPDSQTCCPVSGSKWGCCPLNSAVCCADMKHCCPYGTHCTSQGTCTTNVQSTRTPWSELVYDDNKN